MPARAVSEEEKLLVSKAPVSGLVQFFEHRGMAPHVPTLPHRNTSRERVHERWTDSLVTELTSTILAAVNPLRAARAGVAASGKQPLTELGAVDLLATLGCRLDCASAFKELALSFGIECRRSGRSGGLAAEPPTNRAAGPSAEAPPPPVREPAQTRGAAQAEERSLELAALAQLLAALTPVDAAQLGAMLAPTRWELRAREVSKGPSAPQCGTAPLDVRACKRNCFSSIQQKLAHARSHMPVRCPRRRPGASGPVRCALTAVLRPRDRSRVPCHARDLA